MITKDSSGAAFTAAYEAAVAEPMVSYDLRLTLDGAALPCTVMRLSLSLGGAADTGDSAGFAPGACYSAHLQARLHGCEAQLTGRTLAVEVGVDVGGSYVYARVATLVVTTARTRLEWLEVEAYGHIATKLTAPVGMAEGWHGVAAVAAAIEAATGIPVAIGAFPSTEQVAWVGERDTCAAALSSLALSLGGFAWEDGNGVVVSPYSGAPTFEPPVRGMTAHPELAEADVMVDGLTVSMAVDDGEGGVEDVSWVFGTGRVALSVEHATQAWAETLWANVRGYAYRPGTLTIATLDPRVTPGDVTSVGGLAVPATAIDCTYDGGWFGKISAPGVSEGAEDMAQGPVTARIDATVRSAQEASAAATQALGDAARAQKAADAAQGSADEAAAAAAQAIGDAAAAKSAAATAQADATRANAAASSALVQASIVEDVAGTLQWISEHGSFVPTTDTEPVEGRVYFELVAGDYVPVAQPSGDPSAHGWYVLDVSESQSDYIMAHLAVTSAGLWVLPSGLGQASGPQVAPGYKLLLAADGARLYDDEGRQVMSYGESIAMSSSRPQYIGGEDAYIVYYDADEDGSPDTIRIGGTVLMGGSKTLSEVLAELGQASEDAARARDVCTISLTSTNGTVFKQNLGVSTSIVATLFTGDGLRIADAQALRSRYGAGAFLQWRWKDSGTGDFVTISSADPRLSAGGFVLTVSPQDVSTQAVIDCELVY